MKIPQGMTEKQVLDTIDTVLRRYIKKFTFGIYDKDDIYQEGFLIACEALEVYDVNYPLENFLSIHLKNRLINFKFTKFLKTPKLCKNCLVDNMANCHSCIKRLKTYNAKKNLHLPIDISRVKSDGEKSLESKYKNLDEIDAKELLQLINIHLDIKYREDYLKMRDGLYIHKSIRDEIETKILNIIELYG